MSVFEPLLARLRAFGLARLFFAVVTLSMTLAGTIANYALSGNALRHFDMLLELNEAETFVVSGANAEVDTLTDGVFDPAGLARFAPAAIASLLPPGFEVVSFRTFPVSLGNGGASQRANAYAVGQGFIRLAGLDVGAAGRLSLSERMEDSCLVGTRLAHRLQLDGSGPLFVEGRVCHVAGLFDAPARPPFANLADSILVAEREETFEQVTAGAFSLLVSGPPSSLAQNRLEGLLSLVFDVSRLSFWSSLPIVEQARELKFIATAISVGLSAIILLVGAVSIAALMSFSVTERRREIAIRRTLGATRSRIVVEIVQEALLIAVLALVVGVIGGLALADILQQPLSRYFLAGRAPGAGIDIARLAEAIAGFLAVTLIAGIIPAMNAARTDPATVLRES